jgi:hypothetical protein
VHRAHAGAAARARPEGAGEAGADAVTVEQIVHWGTAGGARVLGFEGVGTLAVGRPRTSRSTRSTSRATSACTTRRSGRW